MAGMRKMKGKYYVRVRIGGKEKLLPTGTSFKRDAEKVLRKIQQQELEVKQRLRSEIDGVSSKVAILEGIKYFEKNVGPERNLQETTVYTYKLAMKDFIKALGKLLYFDCIQKKHFSMLVNHLQKNYNNTTTNIRLRAIRAMLNYLLEKEIIDKLPFKVKQIKIDQGLPKFIKPEELSKIYEKVLDARLQAIFRVYEATGMRVGELKYSHREEEFVIIEKAKNRKSRIIPIPLERIPDYDQAKELDWSVSWISHSFTLACRDAKLPGKTIHCLRHTFAMRKLMETNNISIVKELLGHSSTKVTEIYTQFPRGYLTQVFKDRKVNKTPENHQRLEA